MELSVNRKALHQALGTVGRVASTRSTMPVLAGVRLTAQDGSLEIVATNLDVTIRTRVAAKVAQAGVAVVPARPLAEYVASADAEDLEIKALPKDRLAIKSGKGKSEIRGWAPGDYPAVDFAVTQGPIGLTAGALHEGLAAVAFAAGDSKVAAARPILGGISVRGKRGVLDFAASDSFRLAWKQLAHAEDVALEAILPLDSVKELLRLLGSVDEDASIVFGLWASEGAAPSRAVVTIGDLWFATRLIEGTYPNWQHFVPTSVATTVSIDRDTLRRSVESARIFAEGTGIVRLEVSKNGGELGSVSVCARGDLGESEGAVSCGLQGDPTRIGLHGPYLADAVASMPTDSIKLELSTESRPAVFRPSGRDDQLALIMPMTVKWSR